MQDKAIRLGKLAKGINNESKLSKEAERAGNLAKFDLCTDMVSEFPELQGVMGYYYSLAKKEPEEIAWAIKEHYMPQGMGASIPTTRLGKILALADKLDHLAGCFGADIKPKSASDPFGLRRAALGCIRIIVEGNLVLSLSSIVEKALSFYEFHNNKNTEIITFILDRMRSWCLDKGFSHECIESVLILKGDDLLDIYKRIVAVNKFKVLDEAKDIIEINKRLKNILTKVKMPLLSEPDPKLFENEYEANLYAITKELGEQIEQNIKNQKYDQALNAFIQVKGVTKDFFDNIMVMAEDNEVKTNRLQLLNKLYTLFLQVANLSYLHA